MATSACEVPVIIFWTTTHTQHNSRAEQERINILSDWCEHEGWLSAVNGASCVLRCAFNWSLRFA